MDENIKTESITRWFVRLKAGDDEAATILWQYYFPRLSAIARQRFDADRDPVYGAEDAAASVIHLLCRGARNGRFSDVGTRDDLWRLLVAATRRKVIDRVRHEHAAKRGGGDVKVLDACFGTAQLIAAPDPTPETLCMIDEQLSVLLSQLRDDTFRRIALWKLEGYSNREVASMLDVSERTVERKLKLIRSDWEKEV